MRLFLKKIGVVHRKGTAAARHLPADFASLKHRFLLRIVYLVVTAAGSVVDRVQLLWQGGTDRCHPEADVVAETADILSHAHSASHWSTPATMELLVDGLWKNHVKPLMEQLGLNPAKQAWLILWDVYSSHRDATLLANLKRKYPALIILFVPASCTPKLQPLDVGFNSSWKSLITREACMWLAALVAVQIAGGIEAAKVVVKTTKKELCRPFCLWVAVATREMKNRREECAKAWDKSGITVAWDADARVQLFEEAKNCTRAKNCSNLQRAARREASCHQP
jgi:hypothetical protein